MGNACNRRAQESAPLIQAPLGSSCGANSSSTAGRSIQPYREDAEEAKQQRSCDVISHFLAASRQDGYVTDEQYRVLAGALDAMVNAGDKGGVDQHRDLLSKDAAAAAMLPSLGLKLKSGYTTPKRRGDSSFGCDVARVLESGLDADAVLHNRSFDCRVHGNLEEDAQVILYALTHPVNFIGRYSMEADKVLSWLLDISSQYNNTSYHNWRHAFDVFQLSYLCLRDGGLHEYFNSLDTCAVLLAGISHDVGHTGVNNNFHVNTQTAIACMYNDRSPLENMHCSRAFECMKKPGANFLDNLDAESYGSVRHKIIDMILETDPSRHFKFVAKLSARTQQTDKPILKHSEAKEAHAEDQAREDRKILLKGVLHLFDIGNGFRTWDVYKDLVVALEAEMFAQGDQERELGVPMTPMMDRTKDSLAAGQGFFLGRMVLPLFELYSPFMDEELVAFLRNILEGNKTRWQELVERHGPKTATAIIAQESR